jgi:hypothetical protein
MPGQRKNRLFAPVLLFLLVVLFIGWYAANYDYDALAGVYVLDHNGERCVLDLHSDRSFTEELVHSGDIQKAAGRWYRYGQSHVSFSHEFLKVSGQELNASGEAHGEFEKRLGVFPVLTLAASAGRPPVSQAAAPLVHDPVNECNGDLSPTEKIAYQLAVYAVLVNTSAFART